MIVADYIENYNLKLKKIYDALNELSITGKIALSLVMALSIGMLAQVRIHLPWTPVPMVMTQVGIISYAAVMGRRWGIIPTALYVALGIAGIPWFSNSGSGFSYLMGPTGGYIIGYLLSALFVSHLCNPSNNKRTLISIAAIVFISQFIVIYVPGLLQLNYWLQSVKSQHVSLQSVLMMGFYPFIVVDILKSIIGIMIIYAIQRRQ